MKRLLLVFVIPLILWSCSKSKDDILTGKWKNKKNGSVIIFDSTSSFTAISKKDTIRGNYTLKDSSAVALNFNSGEFADTVKIISYSPTELTLKSRYTGKESRYIKL